MIETSSRDVERKVFSILKVLSESSEPMGSAAIARELERHGIFLSERAVRYHLQITDERGYTESHGRDGRTLTAEGLRELRMALAPEQVGFILARLELLAFKTSFDPVTRTGQVPVNTTLFGKASFKKALSAMRDAYKAGLCVSDLIGIAAEGEKLGDVVIPAGKVGVATVCSVAINGVLLKAGIPMESKFGGILEIKDSRPNRFVAVINYAGTSLDPSEQFIRAKMTSVHEVAGDGNGRILANFREIPAQARQMTEQTVKKLKQAGVGGVYVLGNTSETVCQVTVGLDRVGIVLLGGLNPVAAAAEAGIECESVAESGTMDFQELKSFWELV